jgi:hypothetical protein
MNNLDIQYQQLLKDILEYGVELKKTGQVQELKAYLVTPSDIIWLKVSHLLTTKKIAFQDYGN